MKRKLSNSNISSLSRCGVKHFKSQQLDSVTSTSLIRASAEPLVLTKESLCSLQKSIIEEEELPSLKRLVQTWRDSANTDDLEKMAAPPTPRSAGSNNRGDRGRRYTKQDVRRRRTPSPGKRPTPQTYCTQNMHRARVFVEALSELPSTIIAKVQDILGIDFLNGQMASPEIILPIPGLVAEAAVKFWKESQRNSRDCSLEGDWKASLHGLLRNLSEP